MKRTATPTTDTANKITVTTAETKIIGTGSLLGSDSDTVVVKSRSVGILSS